MHYQRNLGINGTGYTYLNGQTPFAPQHGYNGLGYGFTPTYGTIPGYSPVAGVRLPEYNLPQAMIPTATTTGTTEFSYLFARIEEMRIQIETLSLLIRQNLATQSANLGDHFFRDAGMSPLFAGRTENIRTRENDSQIIMEIFLPNLSMGDVDVEISGNRIICRTRIPVSPASRWWTNAQLPRGFELFELADGRVEFGWLVPVTFLAKEVEATWRDGFMCVYVPKADSSAPRQSVKVIRESSNRKTAEMT